MAWEVLQPILERGGIAARAPQLLPPIRQVTLAENADQRRQALDALADAVGPNGVAGRLLTVLAAAKAPDARRLALEVAARLPPPLPAGLVPRLRPLLRDRQLPAHARMAAVLALLRTTGPAGRAAVRVLRDFGLGLGKSHLIDRLRGLRGRLGNPPALDVLLGQLEAHIKMSCPRCGAELPRPEMAKHLWNEHRLMLDGRRVREPWAAIDGWIAEHAATGSDDLLDRGAALGQQLDPDEGLITVHRLMLSHGLRDPEAQTHLREEAHQRHATLCPHCFALTPLAEPPAPRPLQASFGRLAGGGYVVEVQARGLVSRLRLETPRGVLFRGREPGRRLTRRGRLWTWTGPPLVAALLAGWLAPPPYHLPAALLLLLGALAIWCRLRLRTEWEPDPLGRAVNHAWLMLAPHLHAGGYDPADGEFLAGLALASIGRGDPLERERVLDRLIAATAEAVRAGRASPTLLAPLWRLRDADAEAAGRDPVLLVADHVRPCLTGELPLACAEQLLAGESRLDGTPGGRARLRVLLCARAFEAGLEVWDLFELGRVAPALGQAFGHEDLDGLARLRLVWSLRPTRPWHHCGPAVTVFELANYPVLGGQYLDATPDLLLFQPLAQEEKDEEPPPPIVACGRGLIYRDLLLHEPPMKVRVRRRSLVRGGGYELRVDSHRFHFRADPTPLARKLERWAAYFLKEFLPGVDAVLAWRSQGPLDKLLGQKAVTCPDCGQAMLGRRGEVGVPPPAA